MDQNNTITRLINGYSVIQIKNKKFKLYSPDINLITKALNYYNKILDDIKYDDPDYWLSEDKRLFILKYYNIWHPEDQNRIDELLKNLDKIKIQLFLHFKNHDTKNLILSKIDQINNDIQILHNKKYTFYEHTKESYATIMKNRYILKNSVYLNNRLFFKDKNINQGYKDYYLNKMIELKEEISIKDMRSAVQTQEWRNLWDAAKTRIFGKPILKCNEEQKMAIGVSQMFDNIRKHPKCPAEEILQHSDALDGWILYQNQEQEKEKRKQEIEDKIKDKNAGEVFVMASSKEEIKEVLSLNDPQTNRELKELHNYVKSKNGPVKWEEIPVMRQKIIRENSK